jgi:hypothetical protein
MNYRSIRTDRAMDCRNALPTKVIVLAILALVLMPRWLRAQSAPASEAYIGYSVLKGGNASPLFGTQGGFTVSARSGLGITAEAVLHLGEAFADKSLWTFLAGPTFSTKGKVRALAHVKIGTAVSGCGRFDSGCRTAATFASAFGGGADFSPRGGVAYRAQAEKLVTTFGSETQRFTRLSFGAAFSLKRASRE